MSVPPDTTSLATIRDLKLFMAQYHFVPAPAIDARAARVTATPEARTISSLVT